MELSSIYLEEGIKAPREACATRDTYRLPLSFQAELYVEHSPSEVWSYFSNLAEWRRWSPICRGCRLNDERGELQLGSILEISFAVMGITMTVPSRVVQLDPPNVITWQGQKFGIKATHRYRFIPQNEGTLLRNEETFTGVRLPLNLLMSAWYRASKLSEESLQGIRRGLMTTGISQSQPETKF